jgi:hypothetical protein
MQLINLITLVYLQQDKFDDCHFALGFEELDVAMCSYFVLQYCLRQKTPHFAREWWGKMLPKF